MKKVIEFLKNWFQKNGLIKILAAFALLITSTLIIRNCDISPLTAIFNVIGIASACYLVLTVLIFTIVGIVNSIKDALKKKE
jgi:nicotinamide riboside transporter PnuC